MLVCSESMSDCYKLVYFSLLKKTDLNELGDVMASMSELLAD